MADPLSYPDFAAARAAAAWTRRNCERFGCRANCRYALATYVWPCTECGDDVFAPRDAVLGEYESTGGQCQRCFSCLADEGGAEFDDAFIN